MQATDTTKPASVVASELRRLRAQAGLTRAEVATLSGCSLSMLGSLESGWIPARSPVLARVLAVLADQSSDTT